MVDSLLDLGIVPLWYPDNIVNWKKAPALDFEVSKKIHEYQGTAQEFLLISDDTPRRWSFEVLNPNKQTEFEMLDSFLYMHQGRKKKFWFPLPLGLFELETFISASSPTVTVKDNGMEYRGDERFFLELNNGDKITRHITDFARFEVSKTLVFTVASMPAINIYPADIRFFSFLPLCRFDQDSIKPKFVNNVVSMFTVKLMELLEYSEV